MTLSYVCTLYNLSVNYLILFFLFYDKFEVFFKL